MLFHHSISYAIGMPGGSEMLIILLIVVILFGSSKLPMLGDALGKSIQNFKKSFKDPENEQSDVVEATVLDSQTSQESLPQKDQQQARLEENTPKS